MPSTPSCLVAHNCVSFNFSRNLNEWPFKDPGCDDVYRVSVSGNTSVNSGLAMRRLCLEGLGLGRVGGFHVEEDIAEGRLVPVLEEYNPRDHEIIWAVYSSSSHLSGRVRAYLGFLVDCVGGG